MTTLISDRVVLSNMIDTMLGSCWIRKIDGANERANELEYNFLDLSLYLLPDIWPPDNNKVFNLIATTSPTI